MENNKVYYGVVIFFNVKKGFGFIKPEDDTADMFVHFSDIGVEGFKSLNKGQRVSYSIGENKRGQPKAVSVVVI